MDCHKLPNLISSPDACLGWLSLVFQILSRQTDRDEREDVRLFANNGATIDDYVRLQADPVF